MINLPNDYSTAKAYDGNSLPRLSVGGHICRIRTVQLTKTRKTGADMLVVNFDINEEGEFNGYYGKVFDARRKYRQDAAWPGVFRTTISTREGTTNGFFKGLIDAVEASNPGYSFTGSRANEQTLQGKLVGFNFAEEEYEMTDPSTGEVRKGTTVKPQYRLGEQANIQRREEQERREQARNIIRTQELDVATTAGKLRDEFIKGYTGREQDKSAAVKFATFVLLHGGYMRPAELPRWRALSGSAGKDGRHLTDEDRAVIDANPMKAMVQAAYQKWDSSGSESPKRCTTWKGEYERKDDLIEVYNHLAALGYPIADEEWAWLLGTHACYTLPDGTTLPKEDDEV